MPKPPKAPEKPLIPYMRYTRQVWDQVKVDNPSLKHWEIGKIIGQMWRSLPDLEKDKIVMEYQAEKVEYGRALKFFHNSAAYQAYLVEKAKAVQGLNDTNKGPSSSSQLQRERQLEILPAEDKDEQNQDDFYSEKNKAHSRYLKNHQLISEIFADTIVPSHTPVVTTVRMQVLKRQVQSLSMYQNKLETEIVEMQNKFEEKKERFLESSESFDKELMKYCKWPMQLDDVAFQKLVDEQYELLKKELEQEQGKVSLQAAGLAALGAQQIEMYQHYDKMIPEQPQVEALALTRPFPGEIINVPVEHLPSPVGKPITGPLPLNQASAKQNCNLQLVTEAGKSSLLSNGIVNIICTLKL